MSQAFIGIGSNLGDRLQRGLLPVLAVVFLAASASADIFDGWQNGAAGYRKALAQHEVSDAPMLVYFYTDWCPNCRRLDAAVMAAPVVQQALRRFAKVRVNPDRGPGEDRLASEYKITGYPSVFILPANSSVPQRARLSLDPAVFAEWCATFANAPPAPDLDLPQPGEAMLMMKDGTRVNGKIIFQDDKEILVQRGGVMQSYDRATVDKIMDPSER